MQRRAFEADRADNPLLWEAQLKRAKSITLDLTWAHRKPVEHQSAVRGFLV